MSAGQAIAEVSIELIRQALTSGARIEARVKSDSMSPLIRAGDLIGIISISPKVLVKGDIVVYNADSRLAVHRMVGRLRRDDGAVMLLTKGDANGTADPPIAVDDVAGKIERIESSAGRRIDLTRLGTRVISRLIASLSLWSGVIWGYRDTPSRGVVDRIGKALVRPVGAVTRRAYLLLDMLVLLSG
jgi:signal peptidase I